MTSNHPHARHLVTLKYPVGDKWTGRKNHRGLMCTDDCVCPFDVVPFDVSCSLIFSLFLWLFDFVVLMSLNRDGGSIKLGPQHLLNLSKVDLFVDEVCSPHFDGVWVNLV